MEEKGGEFECCFFDEMISGFETAEEILVEMVRRGWRRVEYDEIVAGDDLFDDGRCVVECKMNGEKTESIDK